eukprot:jgi/Psemu1/41793/gm1.41793_g
MGVRRICRHSGSGIEILNYRVILGKIRRGAEITEKGRRLRQKKWQKEKKSIRYIEMSKGRGTVGIIREGAKECFEDGTGEISTVGGDCQIFGVEEIMKDWIAIAGRCAGQLA